MAKSIVEKATRSLRRPRSRPISDAAVEVSTRANEIPRA
jgi:hypothetical protein